MEPDVPQSPTNSTLNPEVEVFNPSNTMADASSSSSNVHPTSGMSEPISPRPVPASNPNGEFLLSSSSDNHDFDTTVAHGEERSGNHPPGPPVFSEPFQWQPFVQHESHQQSNPGLLTAPQDEDNLPNSFSRGRGRGHNAFRGRSRSNSRGRGNNNSRGRGGNSSRHSVGPHNIENVTNTMYGNLLANRYGSNLRQMSPMRGSGNRAYSNALHQQGNVSASSSITLAQLRESLNMNTGSGESPGANVRSSPQLVHGSTPYTNGNAPPVNANPIHPGPLPNYGGNVSFAQQMGEVDRALAAMGVQAYGNPPPSIPPAMLGHNPSPAITQSEGITMANQELVKSVERTRANHAFVTMHDVAVKMYDDIKARYFPEGMEPFMWPQLTPTETIYVERVYDMTQMSEHELVQEYQKLVDANNEE